MARRAGGVVGVLFAEIHPPDRFLFTRSHQQVERGLGQHAQKVAVIAGLDGRQQLGQGVVGYRIRPSVWVALHNTILAEIR